MKLLCRYHLYEDYNDKERLFGQGWTDAFGHTWKDPDTGWGADLERTFSGSDPTFRLLFMTHTL